MSRTEPKHVAICARGHSRKLSPTALEELILSGKYKCTRCSNNYTASETLEFECYICGDLWEAKSLGDAHDVMNTNCAACEERTFEEISFHLRGSWTMLYKQFKWSQRDRGTKALRRIGRDDYWEGLIHFCNAKQFGAIQESGYIKACRTGLYRMPAVCLTEATGGGWNELKSLHGDFGFVFSKRDILKAGGAPAIYLPQHLVDTQKEHGGFHDKLKPFVNVVRTEHTDPHKERYDFLHEREWRLPQNIILKETNVFGIISGKFGPKTKGWQEIFGAKMMYPEVSLEVDVDGEEDHDETEPTSLSGDSEF